MGPEWIPGRLRGLPDDARFVDRPVFVSPLANHLETFVWTRFCQRRNSD